MNWALSKRLNWGLLAVGFLLFLVVMPGRGEERIWTSSEGKEVTGEMLFSDDTRVFLKIGDKVMPMPLERLSQGDRDFLATRRRDFWQVRAIDPNKVRPPPGVDAGRGFRIIRANLEVLCPDQPDTSPNFRSSNVWLEIEEDGQTRQVRAYTAGLIEVGTGKVVFPKSGANVRESWDMSYRDREPKVPTTLSVLFQIPDRARIIGIGILKQAAVPYK